MPPPTEERRGDRFRIDPVEREFPAEFVTERVERLLIAAAAVRVQILGCEKSLNGRAEHRPAAIVGKDCNWTCHGQIPSSGQIFHWVHAERLNAERQPAAHLEIRLGQILGEYLTC